MASCLTRVSLQTTAALTKCPATATTQPVRALRRLSSASQQVALPQQAASSQQNAGRENKENAGPISYAKRNTAILGALAVGTGSAFLINSEPQSGLRDPPQRPAGPIPVPHDSSRLLEAPTKAPSSSLTDVVHDKQTNVVFPRIIASQLSSTGRQLELVGLGTRTVTLLRFCVYTAGLYASTNDLKHAMGASNPEVLKRGLPESFMEHLFADPNLELALRIIPYRVITFEDLRDGFCEAIEARLPMSKLSDKQRDEAKLHVSIFKQLFPKKDFMLTDELVISKKAHIVTIHLNGKRIGEVSSPLLGECLFRAFMDDHAVSSNIKNEIVQGFYNLATSVTPSQTLH